MARAVIGRIVVFRTINHTGFQRLVNFAVCHRGCVATKGCDHLNIQIVAHHTEFKTFKVFWRVDRVLGVIERTRTGIIPAKRLQASFDQAIGNLLTSRTVHDFVHGIDVFKDERQRNNVCFGSHFTQRAEIEYSPVQTTKTHLLDRIRLIAQNAAVVNLGFKVATGFFIDDLGKFFHASRNRIFWRMNVPAAPFFGLCTGCKCDRYGRCRNRKSRGFQKVVHWSPPVTFCRGTLKPCFP